MSLHQLSGDLATSAQSAVGGAVASDGDAQQSNSLVSVALLYQEIRDRNPPVARWMTRLSLLLATLVVVHALLWSAAISGAE
jgi:hypothetical protein